MTRKVEKSRGIIAGPHDARLASSASRVQAHVESGRIHLNLEGKIPATPERIFTADCGHAHLRLGYPELRFCQLAPNDDTEAARLLIVRYDPLVFRERCGLNEDFRAALNAWAGDQKRAGIGSFADLSTQARIVPSTQSATVDADVELIVRAGHLATITFIVVSPMDRHRVSAGQSKEIGVSSPVQVSMRAQALVDLMNSWKTLVEKESP